MNAKPSQSLGPDGVKETSRIRWRSNPGKSKRDVSSHVKIGMELASCKTQTGWPSTFFFEINRFTVEKRWGGSKLNRCNPWNPTPRVSNDCSSSAWPLLWNYTISKPDIIEARWFQYNKNRCIATSMGTPLPPKRQAAEQPGKQISWVNRQVNKAHHC